MITSTELKKAKKNGRTKRRRSEQAQVDLRQSPLFKDLPPDVQKALLQGKTKSLKKAQLLFMAGDPVDEVFFIFSGKLKEYFSTETGDICLRRVIYPGDFISLHSLFLKQDIYPYTCEVIQSADYFVWKSSYFLEILHQEPTLGIRVATVLSEVIEDSCRLHCLCRKPHALPRVAGFLLRQTAFPSCNTHLGCSDDHAPEMHSVLSANIRPLDLTASNICMARETFSRALSVLQDFEYIDNRGGVVGVLNVKGLKQICGAS